MEGSAAVRVRRTYSLAWRTTELVAGVEGRSRTFQRYRGHRLGWEIWVGLQEGE